jgi:methylenetetrahydrofolate dehydrogenase (NAD+)
MWDYSSVIDVAPLANGLRNQVREYTQKNSLNLVGILANQGPHRQDAELYSERIQQTFQEDGIRYDLWRCPQEDSIGAPTQESVEWIKDQIFLANSRPDVHGILIFYPIFTHGPKGPYKNRMTGVYYKTEDDHFRDLVNPNKDVEGLRGTKWFKNRGTRGKAPTLVYPCTALSVLQILEKYHLHMTPWENKIDFPCEEWKGQIVSIVNRSEIMGRPLAAMLARKGAIVYSIDINSILKFQPNGRLHRCNPHTTTLESCLGNSNAIVTGVPDADFQIPLSSVPEGATIVNVSEVPNLCERTLLNYRPDVRYIPQVGKVTVAVLENNLMNLRLNADKEQITKGGCQLS